MKAQHRSPYSKGSDSVVKMFTDKNYFQRKYELQGAKNIQLLDHKQDGDDFTVQYERQVPADVKVPGFAKKFVPELMTVTQRDTWNVASKTGHLDIELKGIPGSMSCEMRLEDTASGCDLVMDWSITCNVPLVGGKLEKVLWEDLHGKMASDVEVGEQILVDY